MVDTPGEVNSGNDDSSTVAHAGSQIAGLLSDDDVENRTTPDSPKPPKQKREKVEPTPDVPEEGDAEEQPDGDTEDRADTSEDDAEPEPTDDADDDGSAEDSAEDDKPAPELIPVKVDGKIEKVTLDELKLGYSRTAVFTQKTQALAAEKKKLAEEVREVRAQREHYATLLPQFKQTLEALQTEPDWKALREKDPEAFAVEHEVWQQQQGRLKILNDKIAEVQKQQEADARAAYAEYLEGQKAKLVELIPEWVNADVRKKETPELRAYALESGFTEEEWRTASDARIIAIIRKAARYDRLQKKQEVVKQKIETEKTPVKPGSGVRKAPTKVDAARKRLELLGRTEDAGTVIASML